MDPNDKNSPFHPSRLVLTDSKIKTESIPIGELVEVEFGGDVWSPIWQSHLKSHLDAFKELQKFIRLREFCSNQDWMHVSQHPFFQKRFQEPDPSVPQETVGNLFYLLKGGLKVGPFTKDQIEQKINRFDLMMTDSISTDMGKTWIKVYQIPEFDRRLNQNENQNLGGVDNLYAKLRNNNVAGLKVLQGLNRYDSTSPSYDLQSTKLQSNPKKNINQQIDSTSVDTNPNSEIDEVKVEKPKARKEEEGGQGKWFALFVIAFVGIVTILRMWNTSSEPKRTPASIKKEKAMEMKKTSRSNYKKKSENKVANKKPKVTKRAPASTKAPTSAARPARKNLQKARQRINQIRRARTRTKTPITRSRAYKSVKNLDDDRRAPASVTDSYDESQYNDNPDNDAYDDGSTPDEQDPVRSQVSKETLDPEEEYDSEY